MTDLEILLWKARRTDPVAQMREENRLLREHLGTITAQLAAIDAAVSQIERADADRIADASRIAQLQRLLLQQAQLIPGQKLNAAR